MKFSAKVLSSAVILLGLAAFPRVQSLTVEVLDTNAVLVDWAAVKGAQENQERLLRGSTVIKKKTVTKSKTTFASTLFKNNRSYTVKVRVLATKKKSASDWRSKTFTYETIIQPPTVTEVQAPVALPSGASWLFVIDDGEDMLALSTEAGSSIHMGRLDPANPSAPITLQSVASSADTGGQGIADHWHIYAHGYHWIVFSVTNAEQSYLLQLDKDFNQITLVEVAQQDKGVSTNDMFLVAEDDGITVGHFYEGQGHKLYRFNTAAELTDTMTIGGSGNFAHGNGASAYQTDNGFVVFAPTSLDPSSATELYKITYSADWEEKSIVTLLQADDTGFAMGSAALLDDGSYIIHARKIANASDHDNTGDDSGAIVQYRFASDDELVDSTMIVEESGNRPHTTLVGDDVYLTYDSSNAVYFAQYRLDG